MAINERVITGTQAAVTPSDGGTGNQEDGLVIYVDANDVDSTDGVDSYWYDITDHEYTPATDVSEHFNTVTYSGNSSTQAITGVGFQPDLVWIKRRNADASHYLNDSLTPNSYLRTDLTNGDQPSSTFTSFDSDGFTLASSNLGNNSAGTYVAWCFKAGGAPTANNTATSGAMTANSVSVDGTLESAYTPSGSPDIYPEQMSVNTKLGFSIVEYEGSGTDGDTYPHGLGVAPDLVITKRIDSAEIWTVYVKGVTSDSKELVLNNTHDLDSISNSHYEHSNTNANVFGLGSAAGAANSSTGTYIAYHFASKRGISKVGAYKGQGNPTKLYTGFQPAWIMIKNTSRSGTDWKIFDNKRSDEGEVLIDRQLGANESAAEVEIGYGAGYGYVRFEKDGVSLQGNAFTDYNYNGDSYIYLAFAKNTNETSLIDGTNLKIHQDAASYSGSGSTWTADVGTDFTLSVSGSVYNQELGDFLDFNGSTDFAHRTATATTPLDFSAKGYSIEAWINKDDTDTNYVIAKYGTSDAKRSFIFGVANDDKLQLFERSSSSNVLKSSSTVSSNKWVHIAVVRSSSDAKFYINGELDNTVSSTFTPNNGGTQRITIGKHESTTPSFFNGQIGQVRVYGEELSVDDIRQNFYFTKNDYPNGVNFTRYGATFDTSTHTSPDVDVYSLDGSNDYFDSTTFNRNIGKISYTLSAWIYVQGALSGSGGYVIMGTYASSAGMWLDVIRASGKLRLYHTGGSVVNQQSTGTVSQNTWHHVICVRDRVNGKVNFFIDGVAAGSTTIAGADGSADGTGFELGRYNSGYYFNGDIAQVKVYDKALSTTECQALFNQNATTFGKTEV